MRRITRHVLVPVGVALGLLACAPKVKPEQLSQVPNEQIQALDALELDIETTEGRLSERRAELDRLEGREDRLEDRVEVLTDAEETARDERAESVEHGLSEVAATQKETVEAADETLEATEPVLDGTRDRADELELEIAFLETKVTWLEAVREVEKAEGARAGGADLALGPFVQTQDKAFEKVQRAFSAWRESLEPDEQMVADVDKPEPR